MHRELLILLNKKSTILYANHLNLILFLVWLKQKLPFSFIDSSLVKKFLPQSWLISIAFLLIHPSIHSSPHSKQFNKNTAAHLPSILHYDTICSHHNILLAFECYFKFFWVLTSPDSHISNMHKLLSPSFTYDSNMYWFKSLCCFAILTWFVFLSDLYVRNVFKHLWNVSYHCFNYKTDQYYCSCGDQWSIAVELWYKPLKKIL